MTRPKNQAQPFGRRATGWVLLEVVRGAFTPNENQTDAKRGKSSYHARLYRAAIWAASPANLSRPGF
jgi:hypothetical protein